MSEEQQYEKICKGEFQSIGEKIDYLTHRLFEDNGGECLQSKINRHEQFINDYNLHKQDEKTNWSVYLPMVVGIGLVFCDFLFRYITGK
jgi:hypothetical protein